MNNDKLFKFKSGEWLLFGRTLNEVINGFSVPNFEDTIGLDTETLDSLLKKMQTLPKTDEIALGPTELRAIRNALRETIRELGVEEFHTRTGYDFDQGKTILRRIDGLLTD